ncbi:TPA: hypothetical protein DF272_04150 [Candidatus Falkowbacteria bacterium]|nr:hypothetical protein [Candidatus Falkowbacteria bacterium]
MAFGQPQNFEDYQSRRQPKTVLVPRSDTEDIIDIGPDTFNKILQLLADELAKIRHTYNKEHDLETITAADINQEAGQMQKHLSQMKQLVDDKIKAYTFETKLAATSEAIKTANAKKKRLLVQLNIMQTDLAILNDIAGEIIKDSDLEQKDEKMTSLKNRLNNFEHEFLAQLN